MNFDPFARALAGFRILVIVVAGVFLGLPGRSAEYVRGQAIPEVKLKNGTVLHDLTVVAVGSTSIVAKWAGGMGSLPLTQLPEQMRTDLLAAVPVKPPPPAAAPEAPPAAIDPKLASAELPTEIKLTNGFVMRKSVVKRWEAKSVLVNYQGGTVTVRYQNISPEQRAIFEARKDDELARQAKEDASTTSGQITAEQDQSAKDAAAAEQKEIAEKKAEEINNGVSFHYLVKGMTKQQVIQAYGRPPDDSGDSFLYILRGHDKYGNAADRTLSFKDGVLASWRDMREGEPAGAVDH